MILDEVHERNVASDFLTIIMRDLLPKRCELKGREVGAVCVSVCSNISHLPVGLT